MDTGSPITYLPCFGCPPELCGYHEHQYYDWRLSKDFRKLNVSTNAADAAYCDAMPVSHEVSNVSENWPYVSGACLFVLDYGDDSNGEGLMVEDMVTIGDELSPAKMIFGCGGLVEADGSYDRQDGMAGFSRGNTAVPHSWRRRVSSTHTFLDSVQRGAGQTRRCYRLDGTTLVGISRSSLIPGWLTTSGSLFERCHGNSVKSPSLAHRMWSPYSTAARQWLIFLQSCFKISLTS